MTLLTPKWPPACPKKDQILKVEKMIAIIKFLIESKTLVRNFSVFMATLKGTITDWLIGSFYPNFPHWDHKNIKNVPKFSKTSRKYQKIKTTFPKSWQNKKKNQENQDWCTWVGIEWATSFWCHYCLLWTYFAPFSSAYVVWLWPCIYLLVLFFLWIFFATIWCSISLQQYDAMLLSSRFETTV